MMVRTSQLERESENTIRTRARDLIIDQLKNNPASDYYTMALRILNSFDRAGIKVFV